ncbi:MAG: hypothetical protein LC624_04430 [Halobacteriales archaeon]|nr:hypothetical protein [Halobacteriales archaeon]
MRARLAFAVLATGAVLLAGCLGSSSPPSNEPVRPANGGDAQVAQPEAGSGGVAQAPPVQQLVVYPFKGHLTTSLGAQGVGYLSPTGAQDTHGWNFAVDHEAVAIVAELRWADKMQDLDLQLGSPNCDSTTGTGTCVFADDGQPGAGDSPTKIVFTNADALKQAGAWKVFVWAKDAVNADFDASVTVFYGVGPADDYTAFK